MELWYYLQILRTKKQGWLFKKDDTKDRLSALDKISELSSIADIPVLIPFLTDSNRVIQETVCNIIIALFNCIEHQKEYYNILQVCNISKSDLDLYELVFTKEQLITLLAIASLNGSGYVREKAVNKLAYTENESAIQFIVYRLADWVPAIRQDASKALNEFKKPLYIKALINNLSLFEWLQKVRRVDLGFVYSDIMEFIIEQNQSYIVENFRTFNDRTRIIIAKKLCTKANTDSKILQLLLKDKHFLIRSFVFLVFEQLNKNAVNSLLRDKSASIRIQTLYKLKNTDGFNELVFRFLADNSAAIRDFARFRLKNNNTDFATIYNDYLLKNEFVVGALNGLGETNSKKYINTIERFLTDKKIKVRKAAFYALKKLAPEKAYRFAFENLDSECIGLRNLSIEYLSTRATPEVLSRAREIYTNGDYALKKGMLRLFSKIGKWATVGEIMIGTIDDNENIRRLSYEYLERWRRKATTYFTKPNPGDLDRANDVFKFVYAKHEEQKYFRHNPLEGIDFYLR